MNESTWTAHQGEGGGQAAGRVLAGRFRLVRALKQGHGVSTFHAIDSARGVEVVVKGAALPESAALRVEHEAAVLRELHSPFLPAVVDCVRGEGGVYLARRFVPGVTLEERTSRCPLSADEALTVARCLLLGLREAHAAGVLHRDIKPANVIVDAGAPLGAATLIDFGLCRSLRFDPARQQELVGTVRYMSPEQAGLLRRGVDERSDLYAVGAVLHAGLTGRPAFAGRTVGEVLRQLSASEPPALRSLGLAVPRALDEVIRRLLRKDPRDRYQSAQAALADIEEIARARAAGVTEPPVVPGRHDCERPLTEPAFIGRAAELAALEAALQEVRGGQDALVLVEAASGGGKTWLLDEFARRHQTRATVLRAQGVADTAQQPLHMLEEVVRGAVAVIEAEPGRAPDLREHLGDRGLVLANSFPPARALFGPAAVGSLGPETYGEQRLIPALDALLLGLGTRELPVLLLLDDCQWADETTIKLLSHRFGPAAEEPGRPRGLLVVAAFRAEEVPGDHPLRALRASRQVCLPPLPAGDVRALVESMAGPLPVETVDLVWGLSEGSPFMAAEILHGLVEAGVLVQEAGGWRAEATALADACSSRRGGALLARRLPRLPAEALRLLAMGAVLGRQFRLDLAAALAGLPLAAAAAHCEEARRRHMLWIDAGGTGCTFVHDRIREGLLARLSEEERRQVHRDAAVRLEREEPRRPIELAYHFDAAGESGRALPYALAAAATARAQHALEAAEAQYRIAERGAADADAATRLHVAEGLGDVLTLRGHYAEATAALERARALAGTVADRARIEGKLGELAFKQGDLGRSRRALESALASLGHRPPATRLGFVLACLWEVIVQVLHSLLPRLFLARRARGTGAADLLAARLYSRLAYVYWFLGGKVPCFWAHLREMNLAERYPPSPELAQAYSEHAPAMTLLPWFRRGTAYAERSLRIRRAAGDRWGQGQSLHFYGVLLYCASRLRECCVRSEEAIRLLTRTGDRWEASDAALNLALARLRLGELAEAVALAQETYRAAVAIGDAHSAGISLEIWAKAGRGLVPAPLIAAELRRPCEDAQTYSEVLQAEAVRLLLGAGRPEEAVAVLEQARALVERTRLRQEYVAPILPWLATALRAAYERTPALDARRRRRYLRQARTAVRGALRIARSYRNNLPHALREAALWAAISGRPRRARRLIDASIRAAEALGMRHEGALSLTARGELGMALGWPGALEDLGAGRALRTALEEPARRRAAGGDAEEANLSLADRFANLLAAGRRIATALTADEIFAAAGEAARAILHGECLIVQPAGAEPAGPWTVRGTGGGSLAMSVIQRAAAAGHPVAADRGGDDASESLLLSDVRSVLCAPISVRGRVAYCLYVTHDRIGRLFGPDEERIASFIATLAGVALENAASLAAVEALSEERQRLYTQAREALAGRDEFLGIAAHELRTPLTALHLRLESLLRERRREGGAADERLVGRLENLRRLSDRLRGLIDLLLDVTQVTAGTLNLRFETVDLCATVREVAGRFEEELERARCPLVVRASTGGTGTWDKTRIDQVVTNLIANAIKYGAGRPIEVDVEAGAERVTLRVRDHGIGIQPDDQPRIFERFERAVSSRHYGGFGLGLWIVRTIVEAHAGRIWVESAPGQGATFTVELPRSPGVAPGGPAAGSPMPAA